MELERIQRNTPGTVSQQWYEDGLPVDPGTVTIGITRADGTVLVAPGTATTGTLTAARSFSITTTHSATLDWLELTWTSSAKGTITSTLEVVGGFLFTIAAARTLKPLDNATTYPVASIATMRTRVEQAIEDACGVAFVPRFMRETVSGAANRSLVVSQPRVSSVRSVQRDGVALAAGELAATTPSDAGILHNLSGWAWGQENYIVSYEHGYSRTPARVSQAALTLARLWLVDGPLDERTTAFTTADGTFTLSTPGMRGAVFGVPEVDATVNAYDERAMVA